MQWWALYITLGRKHYKPWWSTHEHAWHDQTSTNFFAITFRLHAPHQINTTCWPIEQHFKHNHLLPNHLSKETSTLDIVIRIFQLEKYAIRGASSISIMLKGCNEVLNVGRTKGLELVHHLVKFLTLKNFHRPFPILIEQMMC